MRTIAWLTSLLLLLTIASLASGQFGTEEADPKGPKFDPPTVQTLDVGIVVTAEGGPCGNIIATTPIPIDWPEQQVKVIKEDFSPSIGNVSYRFVSSQAKPSKAGTVKQMVITIPQLGPGEEARAVLTLEITRRLMLPPDQTDIYVKADPKKLPKDVRIYLGASPKIEMQNPKIKAVAKQLQKDNQALNAWESVHAIYDWVRENVEYQEGPLRGAVAALEEKKGDCEELTSLFVAICRASQIPARSVWVPGHSYPEFYLQDDEGKGHWFPCQAAGTESFGGIPEQRPILQKGDNFRTVEEPKKAQRYVAEYLTGTPLPGGGKPKVKFIRQAGGAVAQ